MIRVIVAISKNRVIGNNNKLVWHLPEDLKKFKELTTNNCVVMGRKTFESIGAALPRRRNIIITKDKNYVADGCEVVHSVNDALILCKNDCFIIGGSEIYKQVLPIADKLYITMIHKNFEGDAYFPEISYNWYKQSETEHSNDDFKYSFIEYIRYCT